MKYDEEGTPIQTTVNPDSTDLIIDTTQPQPAAGPWQDGPPPKDGEWYLGAWKVTYKDSGWETKHVRYKPKGELGWTVEHEMWVDGRHRETLPPDKHAPINQPEE